MFIHSHNEILSCQEYINKRDYYNKKWIKLNIRCHCAKSILTLNHV